MKEGRQNRPHVWTEAESSVNLNFTNSTNLATSEITGSHYTCVAFYIGSGDLTTRVFIMHGKHFVNWVIFSALGGFFTISHNIR